MFLVNCHARNRLDPIASAAVSTAHRQTGSALELRRFSLTMNTVRVSIDDSVPSGPGNWLELPESSVSAWSALTVDERREVLAGRGPRLLISLIRYRRSSEQEERDP